jgi:hypothetical protein
MVYRLGRLLQLMGLVLLPIAMAGNIAERLDLRAMLTVAGIGVGVFALGWLLQQTAKPK